MLGSRKHTRFGYQPHKLLSEERTAILACFLRGMWGEAHAQAPSTLHYYFTRTLHT